MYVLCYKSWVDTVILTSMFNPMRIDFTFPLPTSKYLKEYMAIDLSTCDMVPGQSDGTRLVLQINY